MDLLTNSDTLIRCEDCGEPCFQREVKVSHGRHARFVPFQTHAGSIDGDDHMAAFARMRGFYERMFDLLDELQDISPDECRLTYGRLTSLDLGAVMPSACARRTEIVPLAFVRVAGQVCEIQLEARTIDGANVAGILTELKAAAEPVAAMLNAQYEERDF